MAVFSPPPPRDEEEISSGGVGDSIVKFLMLAALLLLFSWVIIPTFIISYFFYNRFLFVKMRLRSSIVVSIASGVAILATLYGFASNAITGAQSAISYSIENMSLNIYGALPFMVVVNLIASSIFGSILAMNNAHTLRKMPYLSTIAGSWAYNFKYRPTPRQIFKRKSMVKDLKEGSKIASGEITPLGINDSSEEYLEEKSNEYIKRYGSEARLHTLIMGGTGAGKSISMRIMIAFNIMFGKPVSVVDFKGDPDFAAFVAAMCKKFNRRFLHFTEGSKDSYPIATYNPDGPAFYDVLKTGSSTAKAEMILRMREYGTDAAVYKENMKEVLITIFGAFASADFKKVEEIYSASNKPHIIKWHNGDLVKLYSALSLDGIIELGTSLDQDTDAYRDLEAIMKSMNKTSKTHHAETVEKLKSQIRTLLASDYGTWLQRHDQSPEIDIEPLMSDGKGSVIMFSINSESQPEFAKLMGSMIMADITNLSVKRRAAGVQDPMYVYIDEFQTVGPGSVASLLEKSRGSFISVTISMQSLEQITANSENKGESDLQTILDTCSTFLVHAGSSESQAERLSKLIGTHNAPKYAATERSERGFFKLNISNKLNKNISTSSTEEYKVPTRRFQELVLPNSENGYKSTAILLNKTGIADPAYKKKVGGVARTVHVIPPDFVVKRYYDGVTLSPPKPGEGRIIPLVEDDSVKTLEVTQPDILEPVVDHNDELEDTNLRDGDFTFMDEIMVNSGEEDKPKNIIKISSGNIDRRAEKEDPFTTNIDSYYPKNSGARNKKTSDNPFGELPEI